MGLLDLFRRKKPTHDEKVDAIYKAIRPDISGFMFKGGKSQISNAIISLARVYGLKTDDCDAKQYYNILLTYADVFIERFITHSPDDKIINLLLTKHSDLVKNEDMAKKALSYVLICKLNPSYVVDSQDKIDDLNIVDMVHEQQERFTAENKEAEKANLDDPEYGLVPNKPVYTKLVAGSNEYLSQLRTEAGEKLTWERLGSLSVEGVNGIIDKYRVFVPSGEEYAILYLNMYASSNSTVVPRGFSKCEKSRC